MPSKTWFKNTLIALFFLLLAVLYLIPTVLNPTTSIPGGFRDAYSILWQVWWYDQALGQENVSPFYTTYHAFPKGDRYFTIQNICFYLPGALLSRLTGPVAAINVLCILSMGLVGYGAFLLFREIHVSWAGGAAGALLMMVSSFITVSFNAGIYYLVASAGIMFLFLFFAARAVKRGRVRDWIAAGVLFSGVGLTSGYCVLIAAIMYVAMLCWLPVAKRKKRLTTITGTVLAAFIAGMILLLPYSYLLRGTGAKDLSEAVSFSKFTASWPNLVSTSSKRFSGKAGEDGQYLVNHIGYLVLALALAGLFWPAPGAGKSSIIAAVLALFWILVATGAWPVAVEVLGRIGMRNIHRFLLGASICLAWLAAGAVSRLAAGAGWRRRIVIILVVGVALAESLIYAGPSCPVETLNVARTETDAFIASLPGEAIVELPMSTPFFSNTMRSYASQVHHGKKLVNPSTNVFSSTTLTVPGQELIWQLEKCIREDTSMLLHSKRKESYLEKLRRAGVCAIVFNESFIARGLGSGGPARVKLVKAVFSSVLGEPVDFSNGRIVYVLNE